MQLDELGGGHAGVFLEMAGKMGCLGVAEFEGNFLDGVQLTQEGLSADHALFIEPLLRGTAEDLLGVAFQLARGDATKCRHGGGAVFGIMSQAQP